MHCTYTHVDEHDYMLSCVKSNRESDNTTSDLHFSITWTVTMEGFLQQAVRGGMLTGVPSAAVCALVDFQ